MMSDTSYDMPGLHIREITVDVDLDAAAPERGTIEVFARVATAFGGEDRPYAVYLQGGPGVEAPRPSLSPDSPVWLPRVLEDYQLILLDQRGTGRSTPIGMDTRLPASFTRHPASASSGPEATSATAGPPATLREAGAEAAAEYLTHFRADGIVRDAEAIREHLGAKTLTPIGQSFGGFTTLHYLSTHPGSLAGAIFTGGLPPVDRRPEEIYATTWDIMRAKTLAYYRRFPGDRDRVEALCELAADGRVLLPHGDVVSPARLRTIGHLLGATGGAEQLHWLLGLDPQSAAFRHDLASALPFAGRNPLYAVIHESSMSNGYATRWAADRSMPRDFRDDPTLLGGEHIHRELFDEDAELREWKDIAERIAEHVWPSLYDPEALRRAEVPAAAAVYFRDAYVPTEDSLRTAALLPRMTPWVTSSWEHNGIRASGTEVISHLIELVQGRRSA
jgi:pimeloyl-ACP methyl ester carboxylesterase